MNRKKPVIMDIYFKKDNLYLKKTPTKLPHIRVESIELFMQMW